MPLSQRDLLLARPPRTSDTTTTRLAAPLRATDVYYDLALQGIQKIMQNSYTLNGCISLSQSVEELISIHQLLFWEVSAFENPISKSMWSIKC